MSLKTAMFIQLTQKLSLTMKKMWCMSPPFSSYHPRTCEFIDKITSFGFKLDEQVGLKLVVNTIQQADIAPLKRSMLMSLINKSLCIGQPAHEYQTVIKKTEMRTSATGTLKYSKCILLRSRRR